MRLYTVLIEFEDRTVGIEQYEADFPQDAIIKFAKTAQSLDEYDRVKIESLLSRRIAQDQLLIQVANKFKGLWIINLGIDFIETPGLSSIFGGYIIQTDNNAPIRSN